MCPLRINRDVRPSIPAAESIGGRDDLLLAGIRAGDEGAFELLYLAYHGPLWRFAYAYVRSRDTTEDIVQDVFLTLWRRRADVEIRESVRVWLYGATRNQALKYLRHRAVVDRADRAAQLEYGGSETAGAPPGMGEPPASPEAEFHQRQLEESIQLAISELPERRRLAITLRWKHGFSAVEIARVLGTSPESVRVLLVRARRELTTLLGTGRAGA